MAQQPDLYDISQHLGFNPTKIEITQEVRDQLELAKDCLRTTGGHALLTLLRNRTIEVSTLHVQIGSGGETRLTSEQLMSMREGQNQVVRFLNRLKEGVYDDRTDTTKG